MLRTHDANGMPLIFGTVEGGATFNPPPRVRLVTMDGIVKRRRMCSSKTRFATEVDAKCFILRRKAKLRAYRCPHCHDWHLSKDRA